MEREAKRVYVVIHLLDLSEVLTAIVFRVADFIKLCEQVLFNLERIGNVLVILLYII